MTPVRRWCLVALGVALVIGVPLSLRAIPVADSDLSAATLVSQVQAAANAPYSGYVETLGMLQLPVADRFTDIGDLFGQRTRMRVWWRGPDNWRVDKVSATGEIDLIHDAQGTTQWDYEKSHASRMDDPDIRLPRTSDLLPPELARRLLADVDESELQRLPADHLAGRDAPGLRLTPAAPQSSISHVDLWVDPSSGIPLRVAVYAKGDRHAAFTSEFLQFSSAPPNASDTSFEKPPGADFSFDDVIDVADAANQFAPLAPPHTVGGLSRSSSTGQGAVGVYGRGVTEIVAIPLWDKAAEPLREQLETTPGVRLIDEGDVLSVGPLGILLTKFPNYGGGWLIAGTVTEDTLIQAAHDLTQSQTALR